MRFPLPLSALVFVVAIAAGGCGGKTKTVTETERVPATFIVDMLGKRTVRPSEIAFSVNRDLVATELVWKDWGKPTATASATFVFDQAPHTSKSSVPGRLLVSRLERCGKASYYTATRFEFDEQPPFQPQTPPFETPC
ncbi:MAG TPA: hypothetical protein VJT75_05080 [Thermoleophilaceae bacterium]|nr:hypothetical protein [Thermoleophilaceae bacterium]